MNFCSKLKEETVRMKSFFIVMAFLVSMLSCTTKESNKNSQLWQKASLVHDTLKVHIAIHGRLVAWKKVDILSPRRARLVSLLVEGGDRVSAGDLILSLWPIDRRNNFATLDIHAPLNGIVRKVYWNVNDTIPGNKPILTIENRENLIVRTSLSKAQLAFVRPDLNVVLRYGKKRIKGAVWKVDKQTQQIIVVVPNQQLGIREDYFVSGYIDLGRRPGTFLPRQYLGWADSAKVRVADDSILTIHRVGTADDSLIFIYPDLPEFNQIALKKILTL